MLEQFVIRQIRVYLQDYLELAPDQLQISLSGEVTVRDVKVKPDAFQKFVPGLVLEEGTISSIRIQVHPFLLTAKPCEAVIDSVVFRVKDFGKVEMNANQVKKIIKQQFDFKMEQALSAQSGYQEMLEARKDKDFPKIIMKALNLLKVQVNGITIEYGSLAQFKIDTITLDGVKDAQSGKQLSKELFVRGISASYQGNSIFSHPEIKVNAIINPNVRDNQTKLDVTLGSINAAFPDVKEVVSVVYKLQKDLHGSMMKFKTIQ